ncbi:helix-turn-helix domain-containing protein [Epilithonimonas xixisoli]|uniref:AraC-like DNA-binding protein n=1 Tax=Epilithonimonas xixisoli TaxID=1476462 RepID=A0A4R8IC79_9FLAO|nr:helix-turn-helix domain-containing protein [Epilithonimonas xixisoli]TDX87250.1 AraC-like DNA-binding protein [Epilithonimonas xixisoli]
MFKPKKYLTALLFLVLSVYTAQDNSTKEIEALYEDRPFSTPAEDLKIGFKALKIAIAANNEDQIKSMLYEICAAYYRAGQYSEAMKYAAKIDSRPGSDKYYSKIYISRIKFHLYKDFGMTDKAKLELDNAFKKASRLENQDTDTYHELKGYLYRDKSEMFTDIDSILKYDQKNLEEFLKFRKLYKRFSNLSMPYNNVGYDYLQKGNLDLALLNYKKAEYYALKADDQFNYAYVCQSFGEYYETLGKPDIAVEFYKKCLAIAQRFNEYKLALAATDYIRQIYLKQGDRENSIKYDQLFTELTNTVNVNKKAELNKVVAIIEKEKDLELINSNKSKYWIIGSLLFLGSLISIFAVYLYNKNKKDYLKFTKVIEEMKNRAATQVHHTEKEGAKSLSTNISDEKEHELMKKLNNFERKEQFLSSEISLGSLASNFNTNVNYLSKVIKKYRNHNFNSYINELRINYITEKLRTNPEYLNYKIAYLSEECGFSSYSSFVSIFKQQTGLTPSKFIEYLSKEQSNNNQN